MEGREAVFCNPQGREILGLRAMSQREPECCDGKWALEAAQRRGSPRGEVPLQALLEASVAAFPAFRHHWAPSTRLWSSS